MSPRSSLALALLSSCAFSASALAANPPANICVELTAWMDQAQSPAKAAEAPAKAPTQSSSSQNGSQQAAQRAPQAQSEGGSGTAVEQPRSGARQVPSGEDDAQKTSGMSGQVTHDGPGAAGPQGRAQESAKSGGANSKPDERQSAQTAKPPEPKAPQPSAQAIEKARQSAAANDLDGCSSAVRDMRMAGVSMPTPLLALAALKPELRRQALKGPAPGVPPIPSSGATGEEPARQSGAGSVQPSAPSR